MIVNILIIDKSSSNANNIESLINELLIPLHIEILKVQNTKEALIISANKDIHLIIIDTEIDDMDKFELIKQIKDKNNTPNIPIMFVCDDFIADEYTDNNYVLGRIDYSIKPIEKYQFLNKVNLYLRHYSSKKELIEHGEIMNSLGSSIDKALEINWEKTVELIPLATAIINEESIIKFSNSQFKEFSNSLIGGFLGNCFIDKENYVYGDDILDWKDIALNYEGQTKVLISKYEEEVEYYVHIKKIEDTDLYTICFHPNEDEI